MKRAFLITWAFAALISLVNLSALWGLAVLPLLIVALPYFMTWSDFLIGPLGVGILAALLTWQARRSVVAVNIAFWFAFIASADAWRSRLMAEAVPEGAACVETHSFLRSLTFADEEYQFDVHAAVVIGAEVKVWSYRELDFFELPWTIYRNLDFTDCRDSVQTLLEKPR